MYYGYPVAFNFAAQEASVELSKEQKEDLLRLKEFLKIARAQTGLSIHVMPNSFSFSYSITGREKLEFDLSISAKGLSKVLKPVPMQMTSAGDHSFLFLKRQRVEMGNGTSGAVGALFNRLSAHRDIATGTGCMFVADELKTLVDLHKKRERVQSRMMGCVYNR